MKAELYEKNIKSDVLSWFGILGLSDLMDQSNIPIQI